ncbi:hypothetical protein BBK14_28640 [Parafrankia soli]|uniref:Uncharacterized protein n=1 Tax=Parafrankia soli TaxID=2599596 RepID=A0A1S1PFN7_9ACTN|nr:hypothetical protein BBK14_28640 [Parafrankia soli]
MLRDVPCCTTSHLTEGKRINVMPDSAALTTQQAADFLHVSRTAAPQPGRVDEPPAPGLCRQGRAASISGRRSAHAL